ncbi:MAG: bifunctional 4-hydroxy-2-oxoglutarate aldolase/2-dehydro-3-deoxy-phosphogluconate aldolase [Lentisphaeria bacterium]|nr:bifunctional 4-hydroxy-2-oxoglutarate aldolase/2-dehydro-3-deoxy-phosphogluconate aldolase [Lentisphaeria bacterium]
MIKEISNVGIVPVAAVESVDEGLRMCEALVKGNLPVIEVTFRTAAAAKLLKAASKEFPEMLLGAGTIVEQDELKQAVDAGAKFGVAPGTNPDIIQSAQEHDFAFFPGVANPSNIETALSLGCKVLKFFPAEAVGGVKLLKAMIAPYRHKGVMFCPTGGISTDNMKDYLSIKEVFAVGGSWMVNDSLIGNWDEMTRVAQAAVDQAKSIKY